MNLQSSPAFALLATLALGAPAVAQQSFGGQPASQWAQLGSPAALEITGRPDVAAYVAEDEARGHLPLRYGALLDVDYSIEDSGIWQTTEDGTSVWRLRIVAPGSKSIGLEFSRFKLPEGAEMYVWEEGVETVLGAYTSRNHQENGGFVFEPFPGESVIVEVVQPSFVEFPAEVDISTVIYDYRGVFELEEGLNLLEIDGTGGEEGSCTINVNCPQGDGWEEQKRATVRTVSGGALCSGALINNTSGDLTQYVLTADHCGQGSNTIFRFNYQSNGCAASGGPTNQNVSGATLLTTSGTTDSRFMRINGNIPASYNPYWAGWSRSSSSAGFSFAFAMGHPGGGPKTITIDGNGATASTNFWSLQWSEGMLQGGNSGGPLFDQNGRIRGSACCVNSLTQCNNQSASFGRFDRFWVQNNIAQWLDPLGLNSTTLDGTDLNGTTPPSVTSISPASQLIVNPDGPSAVTLTGTSLGNVNRLLVNGVEAGNWFVVSPTEILITTLGQQDALGDLTIEVESPSGSDSTTLTVAPVQGDPVLDLLSSSPQFLFKATGLQAYVGSEPGTVVLLAVSTSSVPSILPGLELGIGNNFTDVINLGSRTIDSVTGYGFYTAPLPAALPIGLKLFAQAISIDPLQLFLAAETSNVQEGTILF